MRAGSYAVWKGEVFERARITDSRLLIFRPTSQPRPEGFEYSRMRGWKREVHISEVERRFSVSTTAVWRGQRVEVVWVRDEKALVRGEKNAPGNYPEVVGTEKTGEWVSVVPITELTEVVETYHDSI